MLRHLSIVVENKWYDFGVVEHVLRQRATCDGDDGRDRGLFAAYCE